jgi:hypothetical protein
MSAKIKCQCEVKTTLKQLAGAHGMPPENGPSIFIESESLWCSSVQLTLGEHTVIVDGAALILAIRNALNVE